MLDGTYYQPLCWQKTDIIFILTVKNI